VDPTLNLAFEEGGIWGKGLSHQLWGCIHYPLISVFGCFFGINNHKPFTEVIRRKTKTIHGSGSAQFFSRRLQAAWRISNSTLNQLQNIGGVTFII
jgi:hypothetical protein